MDPKIALVSLFIGAFTVLSHLSNNNGADMRRQLAERRWREFVPRRRRA